MTSAVASVSRTRGDVRRFLWVFLPESRPDFAGETRGWFPLPSVEHSSQTKQNNTRPPCQKRARLPGLEKPGRTSAICGKLSGSINTLKGNATLSGHGAVRRGKRSRPLSTITGKSPMKPEEDKNALRLSLSEYLKAEQSTEEGVLSG